MVSGWGRVSPSVWVRVYCDLHIIEPIRDRILLWEVGRIYIEDAREDAQKTLEHIKEEAEPRDNKEVVYSLVDHTVGSTGATLLRHSDFLFRLEGRRQRRRRTIQLCWLWHRDLGEAAVIALLQSETLNPESCHLKLSTWIETSQESGEQPTDPDAPWPHGWRTPSPLLSADT